MRKIAVVTDSTSVIDKSVLDNNDNLYSIPLHIVFGENSYRDGIDINSNELFVKMSQTEVIPTSSQPSVGELIDLFESLKGNYDYIIYITISSGISGTYQTGLLAKNEVSDNIIVFDSLNTSVIQKQMVLETLDMISSGKNIDEIVENLQRIQTSSGILLVVDDLNYLNRNGRISLAAASIGSMLKLKPVLEFNQGKIVVKKKIRTAKKAHNHLVEIVENEDLKETSKIMIAHADGLKAANSLKENIEKVYPNHDITVSELSPVISIHTGPNTIGVAWIK